MRWRRVGLAVAIGGCLGLSVQAGGARAGEAARSQSQAGSVKVAAATDTKASGPAAQKKARKVATLEKAAAPGAVSTPVTRPHPAPPVKRARSAPATTLVARIDLTQQRMHVTSHGKTVGSWKISSGRSGYATPTGRFRPKWVARMHYSRKYDMSPMPYSVFFNGGIATHGTSAVSRLGGPASHGCIRLRTANARTFYHLVQKHGKAKTRIIVTGRAKASRVVKQSKPHRRRTASRPNAFQAEARRARRNAYGGRRYSANEYERIYRERVRRYHRSRRLVWPGDRY